MSNKGNFSQAMREILGLEPIEKGKFETEKPGGDFSAHDMGQDRLNQDFSQGFTTQNGNEKREELHKDDRPFYERAEARTQAQNTESYGERYYGSDETYGSGRTSDFAGGYQESGNREEEVGTTIITRNTIVEGNIKSFENIELNGKVRGKIDTTKNVGVSGMVQGDIQATDILLEGAQIQGNISSKGALLMDKDTLLVGDVEAQNTRVDGKIKGEVKIGGNGEFLSNSVVVGNITVSNFYVQYGARMQGYINTNFSKNDEENIFGQLISN